MVSLYLYLAPRKLSSPGKLSGSYGKFSVGGFFRPNLSPCSIFLPVGGLFFLETKGQTGLRAEWPKVSFNHRYSHTTQSAFFFTPILGSPGSPLTPRFLRTGVRALDRNPSPRPSKISFSNQLYSLHARANQHFFRHIFFQACARV